jgi:hypothetical protein
MFLKVEILALLGLLSLQSGVNAQRANPPPGKATGQATASKGKTAESDLPLRLTIQIVARRYCQKTAEQEPTLFLDLRARFRNVSGHPVILYKGDNLISEQMISQTTKDAIEKKYESYRELHSVFSSLSAPDRNAKGTKPSRKFIVLQPYGYFQTKVTVPISLLSGNANTSSGGVDEFGAVPVGSHVLQVTLSTWLGTRELAEELRQRWRSTGLFWFDGVTSEPMPVSIRLERDRAPCP